MRVLHPELAAWGLAALVVIGGLAVRGAYSWRHRRRWPSFGTGARRSGFQRPAGALLFATATVLLLAAALTRPQRAAERLAPTYERQDLVVILDRSVSMYARDIAPSRFARAVDEIEQFLQRKPATVDRVALVGFAGTSVVLSYPTADLGSLFFYLRWVREDTATLFGTDMGAALETALSVTRRDGTPGLPPVFVLVSDGDDQGTTLARSAAAVRAAGIRVYTVGIGSSQSVTIPVRDDSGREQLLRDDNGDVMRTRFSEGTLRQLAVLTGGQYYRSTSAGDLSRALSSILDRERRATGTERQVVVTDLYPLLLAAAALTLLLAVAFW